MNTRSIAFFVFSLLGLSFSPEAKALPPAKPTDGSVRFTRVPLVNPYTNLTQYANSIFHSYHLRWKDNAPDADGTELQLRFANAGPFYFLTNDSLGAPSPISNRDAEGYREAIVSVGSPPAGTICQFQVVTWKFNGTKTESSSLLIQTRVPAAPMPTIPPTNVTFLAPANLTAQPIIPSEEDGRVNIRWDDKSDVEAFHQLYVGEVMGGTLDDNGNIIGGNVPKYNHVGFIPFGKTDEVLSNEIYLPFGGIAQQSPNLIPGKAYRFGLRATKNGETGLPEETFPTVPNVPSIPLESDKVTQVMVSGNFTMPALKAPTNLTGSITGENTILLNWTDRSNNETGYEIQYRPITGGAAPDFVKFNDAPKNATSYEVNIGQLATADFRVCAVYKYKPTPTTETVVRSNFTPTTIQLSTTTFLPPTGLTASSATLGISNTVDLTWEDNSESEEGFDVFCRPTGSSTAYNRCVSVPSNITNVSVKEFTASKDSINKPIFTALVVDTSYDFVVRAIGKDELTASPDSNVAVAIPQQGFTSRMYEPITQGVVFNYTATTSNVAARTGITAAGLPAGLSIDSSTGNITGIPTQAGRFPVTLTATYSSGPSATATLMLLVQSAGTTPTVAAAIPNVTIRINEPLRIPLADKFNDPDTEMAVRWETNKGNIEFLLYPSLAPSAVANFMAYVNAGDYTDILVHRHVPNFVLQAGGFRADNNLSSVASRPSPINEPGISNLRWTIAAAKRGARGSKTNDAIKAVYKASNPQPPAPKELIDDDFGYLGNPNSATTDIFINLNNNAANLDNQNGGFTAFGRIATASQATVNAITALPVGDFGGSPIDSIPVNAATLPTSLKLDQVVKVNRAYAISTLKYSTNNVSAQVASLSIENNELVLTGKIAGTRLVTLTATDFDDHTISQTFTITVNDAYLPPSITSQPVSQAVTAGSTATLSVSTTGTSLNYQWRKNGIAITPAETNANLTIANFQADDVGDYDVIISNATSSLTSKKANLTLRSPAVIAGSLLSRIVEVGSPLEIEANVIGKPEPTCVWKRGTTTIAGQTSRKLLISSAKLSDAGQYSVTATNTSGASAPGAGGSATVIVVDKTTQYQNVKAASLLKLVAPVAGQGLTYQWKKGGANIGSGEQGYSGQQDATLIISSVTSGNIGDYTCEIEAPAGLGTAESGIIRLSVPTQAPTLAPFVLPNAFVGLPYRYQIELTAGSAQIGALGKSVVSGLPTGLTCDVNTGFISGIPRATGNFSVKASVSNAVGSASATSPLKVSPMEATTSGTYVASIAPSQSLNSNLGGRLDITLTDNSAFTATLQLAGETLRSAGVLNINSITGGVTYAGIVNFPRPNRKTIQATLFLQPTSIYSAQSILQGSINDGTSTAAISGYRHAWSAQFKSGPPPFISMPFARAVGSLKSSVRFNAAIEPEVTRLGQADTPEGSGYMALTVTNSGTASMVGRLADGTPLTGSTLAGSAAQFYLFQSLNSNTSSIAGFIALSSSLSGDLRWIKGRQPIKERIYQPGFAPTILKAVGGLYFPETNINIFNTSDIENNLFAFFKSGELGSSSIQPSIPFRLTATNQVIRPILNPAKTTISFNPKTGGFNGTFELSESGIKRTSSFQGLVIQGEIGKGYFLLPGSQPNITTSAIESGSVQLLRLFTQQPSTVNVATGANATLSVGVSPSFGSAVTYQWQKNSVNLTNGSGVSGATSATLSLTAVDNDDAASYRCVIKVTDILEVTSKAAQVNLLVENVVVTRSPASGPVSLGSTVTFNVNTATIKGSGTLSYVWLKNGVIIPNANGPQLTITPTTAKDDGGYVARVSNAGSPNGVSSIPVGINMTAISNIQASAVGLTAPFEVLAKTRVTLNVTAVGTALNYQWRKNGVPISKATGASYSFTVGTVAEIGNYDVLVSNPLSVTGTASNVIPISVITPVLNPLITRIPPSTAAVPVNSSVTLSAAAAGGGLIYQWKKDGQNISGATSQTYSFTTDATAGSPVYTVAVSNLATAVPVLSSPLTVSVQEAITSVVISRTAPVGATVPPLTSVTLTAVANGSNLTYQWYNGNVLIPSANAATYNFISGSAASTNNYKVIVSNGLLPNGFTSNVLPVEVAPAP